MMRPIMLNVTTMAVIAVSTSTQITALIALAIINKTVLLGLLPLLLEMVSVMMRPTMLTAITMVEIAVVSFSSCQWNLITFQIDGMIALMDLIFS